MVVKRVEGKGGDEKYKEKLTLSGCNLVRGMEGTINLA